MNHLSHKDWESPVFYNQGTAVYYVKKNSGDVWNSDEVIYACVEDDGKYLCSINSKIYSDMDEMKMDILIFMGNRDVSKYSEIEFMNECGCSVDYKILGNALKWNDAQWNDTRRWKKRIYLNCQGYPCVSIGQKAVFIHRLIMSYLIDIRIGKEIIIHHKDYNKLNNSVSNLLVTDRVNHAKYSRGCLAINCIERETGKIIKKYKSISDAERDAGIGRGVIKPRLGTKNLKGMKKVNRKHFKKYSYVYASQEMMDRSKVFSMKGEAISSHRKQVPRISTGTMIFINMCGCEVDFDILEAAIIKRCKPKFVPRRVISLKTGTGYPGVTINGKMHLVHRVIVEYLLDMDISDFIIHHKDENKLNNAIDNLQLLKSSEHSSLHKSFIIHS